VIFGVFEKQPGRSPEVEALRGALGLPMSGDAADRCLVDGGLGLATAPGYRSDVYQALRPARDEEAGLCGVLCGRIYDAAAVAREAGVPAPGEANGDLSRFALALYRRYGPEFVSRLNGKFAFAIGDTREGRLVLGRDRLGIEPLYLAENDERIAFASTIPPLRRSGVAGDALCPEAVGRVLLFNYNPGLQTLMRDVQRLRPGHLLVATKDATRIERYWRLDFTPETGRPESEVADEVRERLRRAVALRAGGDPPPAVFVSGGMDSSSVLGLLREQRSDPLHTWSYRCAGVGFDESHYARMMAESVHSIHGQAEYGASDVLRMPELVREMNEPFCDVGINIASWILGGSAAKDSEATLTGDGGDELFGGHPIYEADKIARFVDPLPGLLKRPALALFRRLPDSDQKKNLAIKLKRFGESLDFPPALLSHRWRMYYRDDEMLGELLTPDVARNFDVGALTSDILEWNAEHPGGDGLSRSLYSDYHSVVDFYLRRNDLNRRFGLETRYPMLDHELVEFCARIPTSLKIKGWFDTKYILKKAMEPVLPHGIVHREDKLGHSIPLKNWIRDDPAVREFVLDHLSEESVARRGWVRPEFVRAQVEEHMAMRRNNSHRLWTLAVLEMWLREHIDR